MGIIFILAILFLLRIFKHNISVVFFLYMTLFYVGIPAIFSLFDFYGFSSLGVLSQVNNMNFLVMCYLIISIIIVFMLSTLSKRLPLNIEKENNLGVLIFIILILSLYFFNIINEYNSLFEYFVVKRSERYNNELGKGYFTLILQVSPLILVHLYFIEKKKLLRFLNFILLFILLITLIVLGERRILFSTIFLTIFYSLKQNKINLKKSRRIIYTFAFFALTLGILRNSIPKLISNDEFDIKNHISKNSFQFLINGENLNHFIIADESINKKEDFLFGKSYLNTIPNLLPSFLVKEKPKNYGVLFAFRKTNGLNEGSVFASSILGEAISNFGPFISIPFLFLFFFIMYWILTLVIWLLPSNISTFFYTSSVSIFLTVYRMDNTNIIKTLIYNCLLPSILLLIFYFIKKIKIAK